MLQVLIGIVLLAFLALQFVLPIYLAISGFSPLWLIGSAIVIGLVGPATAKNGVLPRGVRGIVQGTLGALLLQFAIYFVVRWFAG